MDKLVVVTGATGQQGGAVAARLLADGWRVRALTRDPASAKARALTDAGAEVVAGNLEDRASVEPCIQGAYGVFSVHPGPLTPGQDEFLAGKNVVDAALAHGVTHLVYSSGAGADRTAALGLQQEKWAVEQYLAGAGISATVLRPASFMENYLNPLFGLSRGGLTTAAGPEVRQTHIALDDIAAFAALAFERPEAYRGRTLELAGDEITPPEVAAAISAATGHTVEYSRLSLEVLRRHNERFARGYELLNSAELPRPDIPALRELHPDLMDFRTWLDRTGGAKLKEFLNSDR
ncbi:NmrA/HSCARG family protein [Amycolatopsis anabasis]|uniref:NmrA/HSCARG family protein n=1 Tax=Amycolatopsis anabasis TaxID=1840409 RepID=UPI00131BBCD2|nr:NmrA/HSCARG family protein [Amycolatopsis anabasis]